MYIENIYEKIWLDFSPCLFLYIVTVNVISFCQSVDWALSSWLDLHSILMNSILFLHRVVFNFCKKCRSMSEYMKCPGIRSSGNPETKLKVITFWDSP